MDVKRSIDRFLGQQPQMRYLHNTTEEAVSALDAGLLNANTRSMNYFIDFCAW